MINTGYDVGGGSASNEYDDEYTITWDDYGLGDDSSVTSNNNQASTQKSGGGWDGFLKGAEVLTDAYVKYKTIENMDNMKNEERLNNDPYSTHKSGSIRDYENSQAKRYSDYQEKVDNLQDKPESELTPYEKQLISQNSGSILPNITGNKIADISIIGLLILLGFKMVKTI